jgi:PIN domain nuclease of toxin-antitoxin system
MTYLLDTHVFIWFREGNRARLGPRCVDTLNAACGAGRVMVSAISFREIGQLERRKLVEFPGGAREWLRKAIEIPGIALVDLDPWTAYESASLDETTRDPWDQLLVMTNTRLGTTFVTRDRVILRYAKRAPMPMLDARK